MKYLNYLCLLLLFSCSLPRRRPVYRKMTNPIKLLRRSDKFENCAVRFAKLDFQSEGILNICREAYKPVN